MLDEMPEEDTFYEQEFFPEEELVQTELPFSVEYDEKEGEYIVSGPRVEKMLGYTNLESEKGFAFFQKFLKDSGILEELESMGINEGDTVNVDGYLFEYRR